MCLCVRLVWALKTFRSLRRRPAKTRISKSTRLRWSILLKVENASLRSRCMAHLTLRFAALRPHAHRYRHGCTPSLLLFLLVWLVYIYTVYVYMYIYIYICRFSCDKLTHIFHLLTGRRLTSSMSSLWESSIPCHENLMLDMISW